ncbi:MAG: helix-turn-helix domain-containing protein [bacterium]
MVGASAGDILQAARKKKRLTLDAVAAELRIPPVQLEALEQDNLDVFAAEVYARGAYVRYARYLGVERQKTYYAFLRSLSGTKERVPLRLPQRARWLGRVWTPAGVLVLGALVGALLVIGYLGLQVQTFVRLPELELLEPTVTVIEESQVVVRGRAETEAYVTVNGQVALLAEDGTFEMELMLRPGINVLQLEARGVSGRTRVLKRDLLVPRS